MFALVLSLAACAQKNSNTEALEACQALLKSLPDNLKSEIQFSFDSPERKNWFFTPVPRKGLDYRKLDASQKKLAQKILKASLSESGRETALAIMQLEGVLHVLEKRPADSDHRDPQKYYFSIFGTPDTDEVWGWRIEGHHLSLNYSSAAGEIASATPLFFGTNPARVPAGMPKPEGTEVLKKETQMGFDFLASLNEAQKQKALIAEKSPYDIQSSNKAEAKPTINMEEGLSFAEMSKEQQRALLDMVSYYVRRSPKGFAVELMQKIEQEGIDKLHFVWMGVDHWGEGHYYRIHSPAILIEYDCTQNNANHVHTVVREFANDWGEDVIAKHIREDH